MPSRVLTDAFVRQLRPAKTGQRYEVSCLRTPGLIVRVTDRGRKSLMLRTRLRPGGNPVRLVLGVHDALLVEDARELVRQHLATIRQGVHPRDVRPAVPGERPMLLREAMQVWLDRVVDKHRRRYSTIRLVKRHILSQFGERRLDSLTRTEVVRFVEAFASKPATGHAVFAVLRSFYHHACDRSWLEYSPCDRVKAARLLGPRQVRQRCLDDPELVACWRAAEGMPYPFGPFVLFLLLTGQRRTETAEARWSEFDLDQGRWLLPASRHKSGHEQLVPLSRQAVALLRQLPRGTGPFVWSCSEGSRPMRGFRRGKARLDADMRRRLRCELPEWCLHDCRRVVRTRLAELRVEPHVAEACVGHLKRGIERHYNLWDLQPEKSEAFQRYADHLLALVEHQEGQEQADDGAETGLGAPEEPGQPLA